MSRLAEILRLHADVLAAGAGKKQLSDAADKAVYADAFGKAADQIEALEVALENALRRMPKESEAEYLARETLLADLGFNRITRIAIHLRDGDAA